MPPSSFAAATRIESPMLTSRARTVWSFVQDQSGLSPAMHKPHDPPFTILPLPEVGAEADVPELSVAKHPLPEISLPVTEVTLLGTSISPFPERLMKENSAAQFVTV